MRRIPVDILPGIKRMCYAGADTASEHKLGVILDPQANVSLISQRSAVEIGLTPLKEAKLFRLGWISLQQQNTYAAYALNLRLTNNNSVER